MFTQRFYFHIFPKNSNTKVIYNFTGFSCNQQRAKIKSRLPYLYKKDEDFKKYLKTQKNFLSSLVHNYFKYCNNFNNEEKSFINQSNPFSSRLIQAKIKAFIVVGIYSYKKAGSGCGLT